MLGRRLQTTTKKEPATCAIVAIGSFATVVAQIDERISLLFTLLWTSLALYLCARGRERVRFTGMSFVTVFMAIALGFYCSVCCLAFGEIGYLSGFFQLYLKCLLMYLIGILARDAISPGRGWSLIFVSYIAASCIYVGWAMINYFPGFTAWLSSMTYLFEAKNSLGQIAGVAAIILIVYALEGPKLAGRWLLYLATAAVLMICILFIQCRTAFLAVCCSAFFLLILKKRTKTIIGALALLLLALLLSPDFSNLFSHAFFIDKYIGTDANTMSSGRLDLWADALLSLGGHELFGLGAYYVDNMYINLLVNIGIVGLVLVMGLWIPRVVINLTNGINSSLVPNDRRLLMRIALCLTIFYIVESTLEAHPPFGPGTCSFMFWMLCGYLDGWPSVMGKSHCAAEDSGSSKAMKKYLGGGPYGD